MPVVVVHTAPSSADLPGVVNVRDEGPPNIHRWWNAGMEEAARMGARFVVVANHDVEPADGAQLPGLLGHLEATGATLVCPGPVFTDPEREWPGGRKFTGWCWGVDLAHGLRAPEEFAWWYGDNWLDREARLRHRGVAFAAARVYHRKSGGAYPPSFERMVDGDRRRWVDLIYPKEEGNMAGIVVAVQNAVVSSGSRVPVVIRKGEAWDSDSPVVREHPDMFSPEASRARGGARPAEERPVERATRAPGERSTAKRA